MTPGLARIGGWALAFLLLVSLVPLPLGPTALARAAPDTSGKAASVANQFQRYVQLGDANGDGFDDVLEEDCKVKTNSCKLTLLLGPDLKTKAWTSHADADKPIRIRVCGDVTKNGVKDVQVYQIEPPVFGAGASLGPVTVAPTTETQQFEVEILNGATGTAAVAVAATDSTTGPAVALDSPAGSLLTGASQSMTTQVTPADGGIVLVIEATETPAGLDVPIVDEQLVQTSATVTVLDEHGDTVATIALDDAVDQPVDVEPVAVAHGGALIVVTQVPGYLEGSAEVGSVTVSAYRPDDGALLWTADQGIQQSVPQIVPAVGDLNDDGTPGVGILAGTADAPLLLVFDGKTGELVGQVAVDADAQIIALEGPDGPSLALVATTATGVRITVLDADLEERWTWESSGQAVLLNQQSDDFTGNPNGFSDIDGDGASDILVFQPGHGAVTLVSGQDGHPGWTATFPGASQAVLADPASDEDPTLVVVIEALDGGAEIVFVDGATGAEEHVADVGSAVAAAGYEAGTTVDVSVAPAGNVDGRGQSDVVVTLTLSPPGSSPGEAQDLPDGSSASVNDEAVQESVIMDPGTGKQVTAIPQPDEVERVGTSAIALEGKDVKPGTGRLASGLALGWLVVPLAVAAVAARQRTKR